METPPAARLRDERRIVVRIASKEEAKALKEQLREEIASRIQRVVDEAYKSHKVVTVQKLKSSNLAIYVNSPIVKKDLEVETG